VHLKKLRRVEGGAKIFGVIRVKNHDFTPKFLVFPILGGCNPHPDQPLISIALARPNTILLVVGEITLKKNII
jgi:hypothetical protein